MTSPDSPPAWLFQALTVLFWTLGLSPWVYCLVLWARKRRRQRPHRAWRK